MKIVWSPRAVRHLAAIRDYIAEDNPESAADVAGKILDAVDLLVAHPDWVARAGFLELANWWLRERRM